MGIEQNDMQPIRADAHRGDLVDPTKNVLDLVDAAVKRMDDLAAAEIRRHDDLRTAEKEHNSDLRDAHQLFDTTAHDFQNQVSTLRLEAANAKIQGSRDIIELLKEASILGTERVMVAQDKINLLLHDTISRTEHERLVAELAAYKLEVSQTVAAKQVAAAAATEGALGNRTETRASIASGSNLMMAIAVVGGFLLANFFHLPSSTPAPAPIVISPPQQQTQPTQQYLVPPGMMVVPIPQAAAPK